MATWHWRHLEKDKEGVQLPEVTVLLRGSVTGGSSIVTWMYSNDR